MSAIDAISVFTSVAFLTYGSWSDVKTREVPDRVWLALLPVAITLTSIRVAIHRELLQTSATSVILCLIFSALLLRSGFFGGADVKALICISVSNPMPPMIVKPVIGFLHPFFPITVFCNSCLIALSSCVYVALRNALLLLKEGGNLFSGFEDEPAWRKALAFVSGYKADLSDLEEKRYLYPMERLLMRREGAMRRFTFLIDVEADREEMVEELRRHVRDGSVPREVWVSPGLPMLVFLNVGYALSTTLGDLTSLLIRGLVHP